MMPKKGQRTDERAVDFTQPQKGASEGVREEQIALHGVNHLGDRGRWCFHLHKNFSHAAFPGIRLQDKLALIH